MSITSRINEMSSHIEQAYDELQGLGADLTNVDKNIDNIASVLDDIYDSLPSVSGEGASLTLDDTRVGKIKSTLKGNTSQDGTPTPSSPIPVNVVSGDNEINVVGKNLLNLQTFVKGRLDSGVVGYDSGTTSITTAQDSITFTTNANYRGVTSDFIIVEPSTDYILHQDTELTGISITTACYDSNKTYLGNATNTNIDSKTKKFTMLANTKFFRVNYQLNSAGTTTINKPQLEKGSSVSEYEPYQGNTYNIDLPEGMELCKIENYQDYFYKDSDKWYWHREIGKVVLNGSETIYERETSDNTKKRFRVYLTDNLPNQTQNCLCNKLMAGSLDNSWNCINSITTIIANTGYYGNIVFYREDYSSYTAEQVKTALSQDNMIVYYVLATPTTIEITYQPLIDQLNLLEKALSKQGQTNISQVNNDLPFIISASALKEWSE